jgi:hypothetical protein
MRRLKKTAITGKRVISYNWVNFNLRQGMAAYFSLKLPVKLALLGISLLVIVLTAWLSPLERTLGENIRLVYVHGAWAWAGQITYAAAALAGLVGLLFNPAWHAWSRALGWTGLCFWWTYLPMSMVVMQINWGGIFWSEPRFQTPLAFGITGLLLQAGLWLMSSPRLTSAGNLLFGVVLWAVLRSLTNVLHPDSPIADSGSLRIQTFFVVLLIFALVLGAQLAIFLWEYSTSTKIRKQS